MSLMEKPLEKPLGPRALQVNPLKLRTLRAKLEDDPLSKTVKRNLLLANSAIKVVEDPKAPVLTVHSETKALILEQNDKTIYSISPDQGGFCVHTKDGWINLLPFDWVPRTGPLALLSNTGVGTALIANACREIKREASFIATVGEEETLSSWLDLAACHEEIVAIGMVMTSLQSPAELASVAKAVSIHVPIVALVTHDLLIGDPWLKTWLSRQGIIVVDRLSSFTAALLLLSDLNPPLSRRCAVLTSRTASSLFLQKELAQAKLKYQIIWSSSESSKFLELSKKVLGNKKHDLLILVIDPSISKTFTQELGVIYKEHLRQEEQEIPLLVISAGTRRWTNEIATRLHAFRIPTLCIFDNIGAGLVALQAWKPNEAQYLRGGTIVDHHRTRRALRKMLLKDVSEGDPDLHAELLASLAIPVAPFLRAASFEEAKTAASKFTYPIEVSALHDGISWDQRVKPIVVEKPARLKDVSETVLARARQIGGHNAELILRQSVSGIAEFGVELGRHPIYGILVTLVGLASSAQLLPPITPEMVREFIGKNAVAPENQKSIILTLQQTIASLVAVMNFGDALDGIRIDSLIVHAGGSIAGSCMVKTKSFDEL